MAINPSSEYPGKITTPSAAYPYGEARNITVPSDGTGTPLEQKWVNDVFGMLQALLKAHGVTPSGTPEQVGASQILQCLTALSSGLATLYSDSGTADAYVLDPATDNQGPASYFDGMEVIFPPTNTNTGGAVTVNVDGVGNASLTDKNGGNLPAGTMVVGQLFRAKYDAANTRFYYIGTEGLDLGAEVLSFAFAADANDTLTTLENLYAFVHITGSTLTAARTLTVSNSQRLLFVKNDEGHAVTAKTSAGTGIAVNPGEVRVLYGDGTNVIDPIAYNSAGTAKAWINFNGTGTVAIRDSHNVSGITDNGTGDYTVTYSNPMANSNYNVAVSPDNNAVIGVSSISTTACNVQTRNNSFAVADQANVHVAVHANE